MWTEAQNEYVTSLLPQKESSDDSRVILSIKNAFLSEYFQIMKLIFLPAAAMCSLVLIG